MLIGISSYSQNIESFSKTETVGGSSSTLTLDFLDYPIKKRIDNGHFKASLDLGEDFLFGDEDFLITINFNLTARLDGVDQNDIFEAEYELAIVENQPEAYIIADFKSFIDASTIGDDESLLFDEVQIDINSINSNHSDLNDFIRIQMSYEVDLGFDVSSLQSDLNSINIQQGIKNGIFNWVDDVHISHYQLQLLRLYNISQEKDTEEDIMANLDWKIAMTIEVDLKDPSSKNYSLQIAGGTGFYVARIRPVGGYFLGGSGNSGNWGLWSSNDIGKVALVRSTIDLPYFYFEDNEENVNWIYSRVFTEDSKVKENVTYADGLLKLKQEQTYLPSKNITLIKQTVYDKIGRPAITSIPVPVPGKQNSFRSQFMTAAGTSEVYNSDHFDTDVKLRNPDKIDESGDFSYYNDNPDKSIPNAEGFGYTRTIYYNDGLGRVKEQSGVGKSHSVDQTEGGRTTRYLYATPTDEELIAIFGDEAPSSESVLKSITIDPNNTASVTYISKSGNVIATSLVFSEGHDNLSPLDNSSPYEQTLRDKLTVNLKRENGFSSSKRISLAVPTDLNVSYSIKCAQIESLCQVTTLDCNFQLDIILHTLDDLGNIVSTQPLVSQSMSGVACQDVEGEDFKVIPESTFSLNEGSYIVEKSLKPMDPESTTQSNRETIENGVFPITDMVAEWLESIENLQDIQAFNQSIDNLAQAANSQTLDVFTNNGSAEFEVAWPQEFLDVYALEGNDEKYSISFAPVGWRATDGRNPIAMFFNTPCCVGIEVPVQWLPPFDGDPTKPAEDATIADGTNDVNVRGQFDIVNFYSLFDTSIPENERPIQEFYPDFEGYMLSFFDDCVGSDRDFQTEQLLKDAIYRDNGYMDGWEVEGTFNQMVYHMLTDTYDVDGGDQMDNPEQVYDFEQLKSCWIGVLSRLKEEVCVKVFDFYSEGEDQNISNTFDDRNDDPSGGIHDNHFDSKMKGGFFLTRWIAKRKISKRMRGLQLGGGEGGELAPALGQFHVVEEFLNCTGYQFAKIISPFDPLPLGSDLVMGYDYWEEVDQLNEEGPVPIRLLGETKSDYFNGSSVLSDLSTATLDHDYKYIPITDWDPIRRVKVTAEDGSVTFEIPSSPSKRKSIFPFIKNPIYAYKYFVYENEGASDYQIIEQSVCYEDPNDCFATNGDGFIIRNADGSPMKVPCCSSTPSATDPGCFRDYQYPNLATMSLVNHDVFGEDGGGRFKYVVDDFCSGGRIVCDESHDDWTSGQRLAFYDMLSSYEVEPVEGDFEIDPFDLTCDNLSTETSWYVYMGTEQAQVENELDDIISQLEIDALGGYSESGDNYTHTASGQLYMQLTLDNGDDNFAYYELEIENRIEECQSGCENLRDRFQTRLFELFEENCYEIDGCRTDHASTHNVIPVEDVEAILEQLVLSCQEQCVMTTYSCEDIDCRPLNLPQTEIGSPVSQFDIHYGVGGYPDNPEIIGDVEGSVSHSFVDIAECTNASVTGFQLCDLKDNVDNTIKNLSWYEYTLLKQVQSWDFELDIESYCEGFEGTRKFAFEEPSTPNSTRGSSFVPKDRYEVELGQAVDGNNPGDPVEAPVKCIYIKVESED